MRPLPAATVQSAPGHGSQTSNTPSPRLPQVDIMRGLAAFGVFVSHAAAAAGFPKRALPPISLFGHEYANIPSLFTFGATGVSLFFVISGFCLSLQPLNRQETRIAAIIYFRNRSARIYPAYFMAVLFSIVVASALGNSWTFPEAFVVLTFLQGAFHRWYFSFNGVLWSMSVEVQFYLVFPLLYFGMIRMRRISFIGGIFLSTLVYRYLMNSLPSATTAIGGIVTSTYLTNLLPGRVFEFGLGMTVASLYVSQREFLARVSSFILVPTILLGIWARGFGPGWLADPLSFVLYEYVELPCWRKLRGKE